MISSLKSALALSAKQYEILAQATQSLEAAVQRGEFTAWSIACPMRLSDHAKQGEQGEQWNHEEQTILVSCCYADEWLRAAKNPQSLESAEHPLFDLASLTKPLLAGLSFCLLNGQHWRQRLFEPGIATAALKQILGGQEAAEKALAAAGDLQSLRLIDFFSHQAGFPAWRWFGRGLFNPDQKSIGSVNETGTLLNFDASRLQTFRRNLVGALLTERSPRGQSATGALVRALYSDCGYYLLCKILGAPGDQPFAADTGFYWRNALHMINTTLGTHLQHASLTPGVAQNAVPFYPYLKTEDSGGRDASSFATFGPCNDTNANILASLGPRVAEVSCHAGLFGSVRDVWLGFAHLVSKLVNAGEDPAAVLTPMRNDRFCFCLDTPTGPSTSSAAAPEIAREVFGHLGYTGTSVWFHRPSGNGWVLLTNRTASRTESRAEQVPRLWRVDVGEQSVFAIQEPGNSLTKVSADDWLECRERNNETGVLLWDSRQCGPIANIGAIRRSTGTLLWQFAGAP